MPEVHFEVRWPSGLTRRYYSPSTIVHEHLKAGTSYGVQDFLTRAETAMNAASERVREKFGYACSSRWTRSHRFKRPPKRKKTPRRSRTCASSCSQ